MNKLIILKSIALNTFIALILSSRKQSNLKHSSKIAQIQKPKISSSSVTKFLKTKNVFFPLIL